ncbi:hypothetical protein APX70_200463 [Pseudomonas syringae pv. maculicola]|uniref:Uncharacterized protein n=1 Tax=Pseudomonas syringae pv. maculicola TaxID=59511 RepID=A0A3M3AGI5_PSEYM|nr:hypothetical protein APX70_200463 [Pseudomonas syringae pv. maculicola]
MLNVATSSWPLATLNALTSWLEFKVRLNAVEASTWFLANT